MVTLTKRATASQKRILRAVEGAVLNVQDAHNLPRDPRMARSIAKRATGTLTAQWQDVLALRASMSAGQTSAMASGKASYSSKAPRGAVTLVHGRTPLNKLVKALSEQLGALKKEDPKKAEAFIEVLRMIDKLSPRHE